MNNQVVLSSLAMDLRRVAMGYHRGSKKIAERFFEEALKRKDEVDRGKVKLYVSKLLDQLPDVTKQADGQRIAEDILMYSTLFQNAAMKMGEKGLKL